MAKATPRRRFAALARSKALRRPTQISAHPRCRLKIPQPSTQPAIGQYPARQKPRSEGLEPAARVLAEISREHTALRWQPGDRRTSPATPPSQSARWRRPGHSVPARPAAENKKFRRGARSMRSMREQFECPRQDLLFRQVRRTKAITIHAVGAGPHLIEVPDGRAQDLH